MKQRGQVDTKYIGDNEAGDINFTLIVSSYQVPSAKDDAATEVSNQFIFPHTRLHLPMQSARENLNQSCQADTKDISDNERGVLKNMRRQR